MGDLPSIPADQPDEVESLLSKIGQIGHPLLMSRRAELCESALRLVSRQRQAPRWAYLTNLLAGSLFEDPLGDRAENLERAISLYQEALEVYTREAFPYDWAVTHNNLAAAYFKRIHGVRAGNIEKSISHYENALTVMTRKAYPQLWSTIQDNLGMAYGDRRDGNPADSRELALAYHRKALGAVTRKASPQDWANRHTHLANAYLARVRGARADNLEQAIWHHKQALRVHTRKASPVEWATIYGNLAAVYQARIRGERADNLEKSISAYHQVLQVHTRKNFPFSWAAAQLNLGNSYNQRIRGRTADNLEQAITHYEQALEIYTREGFPEDWAKTQLDLAAAYSRRIHGRKSDNIETAIDHLRQAMEVYTREAFPEYWATVCNNLAMAYSERIDGVRADNLEQAITLYQQTLEIRTRDRGPQDWAATQQALGNAYQQRVRGHRADNLEQAIACHRAALIVYTPEAFPQSCRDTAYWLGRLLHEERRYPEARTALETAHHAVEALRTDLRRDIAKRSLSGDNADLYARLVSCCLAGDDVPAAFQYAAAGKGRAFVDLLATARVDLLTAEVTDPGLAKDLARAREMRQQADNLLAALTGEADLVPAGSPAAGAGPRGVPAWQLITQLRSLQERERRHWEEMAYKYPALTATQQAPALSADAARELSRQLGATLVEYYRQAGGWCAFVVSPGAVDHIPLPLVTSRLLARMMTWMDRLDYLEGRGPITLVRLAEWHDAVLAPLRGSLPRGRPVVLAPFSLLHVLPLSAARDRVSGRYASEEYQIGFAASLSALSAAHQQACRSGSGQAGAPARLLNVAYPGVPGTKGYLENVLTEAEGIAGRFARQTPLYDQDATPDAVVRHSRDHDVIHFGCHGWFDVQLPEQSGLRLAGGWLTVQRIITELHTEQAQVATVAACLTAREKLEQGDEHVGLVQAMLTSGVQAVVASLWSVDDAATRVLLEAFYGRIVAGDSPAAALQAAAAGVRSQPGWQHPYYWAAFQASGITHGVPAALTEGDGDTGEGSA